MADIEKVIVKSALGVYWTIDKQKEACKMRVGIFTFHYNYNYGALLQCLALCRTLKNLGVDADVIQYVPEKFCGELPLWRGLGIRQGQLFKNIVPKLIAAKHGPKMRNAFHDFRKEHITFSNSCSSPTEIAEVASNYDALITGSDQVWHFTSDAPFFLECGEGYCGKRISYAPCCGHAKQPQGRTQKISEWLSRFDHISVRNDFSKSNIEKILGRTIPIVADPTLLIDLSDAQKQISLPYKEYILMYTLGGEIGGGHKKAIQLIRDRVGDLPVVAVISSASQAQLAPWADYKIWSAGPAEWLYLVANSSFVFTDSFHGAIYALKNNLPFVVYYSEEGRSPRLVDLSKRYHLGCSVAKDNESLARCLSDSSFGNHNESLKLVASHVDYSMKFLRNSLSL